MALELTLDSIDALDDNVKKLYIENEGIFHLDVNGLPDVTGLKAKNTELLGKLKTTKDNLSIAETEAEKARQEALKKSGDIDALEKSWRDKHQQEIDIIISERDEYKNIAIAQSSGQEAMRLSSEIALTIDGKSTARHLVREFEPRLKTEFKDGKAVTIVLDKTGHPSAQTLDELREEIRNEPTNAAIVIGTKGSGGGISPNTNTSNIVDISKMSPQRKIEYAREQLA